MTGAYCSAASWAVEAEARPRQTVKNCEWRKISNFTLGLVLAVSHHFKEAPIAVMEVHMRQKKQSRGTGVCPRAAASSIQRLFRRRKSSGAHHCHQFFLSLDEMQNFRKVKLQCYDLLGCVSLPIYGPGSFDKRGRCGVFFMAGRRGRQLPRFAPFVLTHSRFVFPPLGGISLSCEHSS